MVNLDSKSTKTDLSGVLSKVDSAITDMFPSCSLLLHNWKVNLSKVKVILGHMTARVLSLRHMAINEHVNMY